MGLVVCEYGDGLSDEWAGYGYRIAADQTGKFLCERTLKFGFSSLLTPEMNKLIATQKIFLQNDYYIGTELGTTRFNLSLHGPIQFT